MLIFIMQYRETNYYGMPYIQRFISTYIFIEKSKVESERERTEMVS